MRRGITVLDQVCGSGAFLFAALNVLESLYQRNPIQNHRQSGV